MMRSSPVSSDSPGANGGPPDPSARAVRAGRALVTVMLKPWGHVLDLIYPACCAGCGAPLLGADDKALCPECRENLSYIGANRCGKCGMALGPYADPATACPSCRAGFFFKQAAAPCRYEGVTREMILRLKYGREMSLGHVLSRLLVQQLERESFMDQIATVVPVPLHWRRRIWRRFNQSEILARAVAGNFGKTLSIGNLRRIRNTRSQTTLTGPQRQENIRGAFRVHRPARLEGKVVLLVDDVLTTCSTAAECSRTLIRAGAKRVYAAAVAR